MLREGKIFTYQANDPYSYWMNENEHIYESIDQKGNPYVQYTFDAGENKQDVENQHWVKSSNNKNRSYGYEDYEIYVNSPNLEIRNSFHLMFLG